MIEDDPVFYCEKVNHMESPELKMPGQTCSGVSFILAHESDTDPSAVSQLEHASQLQGCIFAIGMPDLHAGKGIPIGAVIMTEESVAYPPQLVYSDIGCGMSWVFCLAAESCQSTTSCNNRSITESIDGPFASTAELMKLCAQPMQQLLQTDLGGVVVCEKKDLVYEEAPTSYKDIDNVIKCLANDVRGENEGLVRILATLRPILTYKYKDPYIRR
jgi:RNA-splicing ligase RtcB